jgi:hypothetical protein
VVFAKKFESEHILIRFPEDPSYQRKEGRFKAVASHWGVGEFALLVRKKLDSSKKIATKIREISYRDEEFGRTIRERHIETTSYQYILRFSHPEESSALFSQFADSFEIEYRE